MNTFISKKLILISFIFTLCPISAQVQNTGIEKNWGPRHNRATISPSLVHLELSEKQGFKTVMVATRLMAADVPKETNWAVNDIPGGNPTMMKMAFTLHQHQFLHRERSTFALKSLRL